MAAVSNKTARLRPVVPSAVEPKQELHKLPAEAQQQYVNANDNVEPISYDTVGKEELLS